MLPIAKHDSYYRVCLLFKVCLLLQSMTPIMEHAPYYEVRLLSQGITPILEHASYYRTSLLLQNMTQCMTPIAQSIGRTTPKWSMCNYDTDYTSYTRACTRRKINDTLDPRATHFMLYPSHRLQLTLFSLSIVHMDLRVLILAVSIFSLQFQGVLSTDKPVYFSLVVSYGEYGYNSSGGIPAINIALEQIRARNILPGYNLTYEVARNSKVDKH